MAFNAPFKKIHGVVGHKLIRKRLGPLTATRPAATLYVNWQYSLDHSTYANIFVSYYCLFFWWVQQAQQLF